MLKLPCTPKESSEKPAVTAGTREREISTKVCSWILKLRNVNEESERGRLWAQPVVSTELTRDVK